MRTQGSATAISSLQTLEWDGLDSSPGQPPKARAQVVQRSSPRELSRQQKAAAAARQSQKASRQTGRWQGRCHPQIRGLQQVLQETASIKAEWNVVLFPDLLLRRAMRNMQMVLRCGQVWRACRLWPGARNNGYSSMGLLLMGINTAISGSALQGDRS